MTAELRDQRHALDHYRAELGYIDVLDPSKIYATGCVLPAGAEKRWRWRIYLPPSGKYVLRLTAGLTRVETSAGEPHGQPRSSSFELPKGGSEFLLQVVLTGDVPQTLVATTNGESLGALPIPETWGYFPERGLTTTIEPTTVKPRGRWVWEPNEVAQLLEVTVSARQTTLSTQDVSPTILPNLGIQLSIQQQSR